MQVQKSLASGGKGGSELFPVPGLQLHGHGVPKSCRQMLGFWNHQVVVVPIWCMYVMLFGFHLYLAARGLSA